MATRTWVGGIRENGKTAGNPRDPADPRNWKGGLPRDGDDVIVASRATMGANLSRIAISSLTILDGASIGSPGLPGMTVWYY